MKIIAVGGQKGGTGKTTTTVSLAMEAFLKGQQVLVVDADPQGSTMTWAQVMVENDQEGPTVISMGEGMHRKDQLARLAQTYDVVFIDCPPRFGKVLRSALMVADMVLLPCGPSDVDVWALAETLDLVEMAQDIRPSLQSAVVITKVMRRTTIGRTARRMLQEGGHHVFKTELGYRVAYQVCMGYGQGPSNYEPKGKATREVSRLYEEVIEYMDQDTTVEVTHAA